MVSLIFCVLILFILCCTTVMGHYLLLPFTLFSPLSHQSSHLDKASHDRDEGITVHYVMNVSLQLVYCKMKQHPCASPSLSFCHNLICMSRYYTFIGGNLVIQRSKNQNILAISSAVTDFLAMAHVFVICLGWIMSQKA